MKKTDFLIVCMVWLISHTAQTQEHPIPPSSYSLDRYNGTWDKYTARHLAVKACFGASYKQIKYLENLGMDRAVEILLRPNPEPSAPVTYYQHEHSKELDPLGKTWHDRGYPVSDDSRAKRETINARRKSLESWTAQLFLNTRLSIHNRMFLFYINHFGAKVTQRSPRTNYDYLSTIYQHSLGNFRTLLKKINKHPVMLFFLNGDGSGRNGSAPNQNYGREFFELYTVGKGAQVGPEDYSHYMEQDVVEASKIFSGYVVRHMYDSVKMPTAYFVPNNHDKSVKVLSYHFQSQIIENMGEKEMDFLTDVVLNSDKFGYYFCEELYTWFVGPVTDQIRLQVIPQMRKTLVENGLDVVPVLRQLLSSKHFYSVVLRGTIVKSPYDYVYSIYHATDTKLPDDIEQRYHLGYKLFTRLRQMRQSPHVLPSVAGWSPYRKTPHLHRLWINATSLRDRKYFTARYIYGGGFTHKESRLRPDGMEVLEGLSNPKNPIQIIDDLCFVVFPRHIADVDKDRFADMLVPQSSTSEKIRIWKNEYRKYEANPTEEKKKLFDSRIRRVLRAMMEHGSFHTF